MPQALTSSTSPPGGAEGSGTFRNSTVLGPVKYAAFIWILIHQR